MKFILVFILVLTSSNLKAECTPDPDNCELYLCKAQELKCNSSNYLISFGYKYCEKFLQKADGNYFSEEAKDVLHGIRYCLQQKLQPTDAITCQTANPRANQHHIECYSTPSFCNLKLSDHFKILYQLGSILFKNDYLKTMQQIQKNCLEMTR